MGWIDDLRSTLGLASEPASEEADLELAAAVLLVEMARADEQEDVSELAAVSAALQASFPSMTESVEALIARAKGEQVDLVSFFPYIEQINQQWSRERKLELLAQLWTVAQADGRIDRYEENYLRKICELLNLPPKTFIQVREGFIE